MVPIMSEAELSRRERQILEILFERGPSTVAQITDSLPDPLSRNAVRTFLTHLVSKKAVTREKHGREFTYHPATEKSTAAQSALSRVLDVFFNGSLSDAVAARFGGGKKKISDAELARLEALLEEARQQKGQK